jgi:hypothetical protein
VNIFLKPSGELIQRYTLGKSNPQAFFYWYQCLCAIINVVAATDNAFTINTALLVKKAPVARHQVDVQANTAILTQVVTNLEMAKVTLLKETPLIQVIDKPILPLKKETTGKLKSLIVGGFLAEFLAVLFLVIKRKYYGDPGINTGVIDKCFFYFRLAIYHPLYYPHFE